MSLSYGLCTGCIRRSYVKYTGALPEEIVLKKAVAEHLNVLKTLTDSADRKAAMSKLADLQMRLSLAQKARRGFIRIS